MPYSKKSDFTRENIEWYDDEIGKANGRFSRFLGGYLSYNTPDNVQALGNEFKDVIDVINAYKMLVIKERQNKSYEDASSSVIFKHDSNYPGMIIKQFSLLLNSLTRQLDDVLVGVDEKNQLKSMFEYNETILGDFLEFVIDNKLCCDSLLDISKDHLKDDFLSSGALKRENKPESEAAAISGADKLKLNSENERVKYIIDGCIGDLFNHTTDSFNDRICDALSRNSLVINSDYFDRKFWLGRVYSFSQKFFNLYVNPVRVLDSAISYFSNGEDVVIDVNKVCQTEIISPQQIQDVNEFLNIYVSFTENFGWGEYDQDRDREFLLKMYEALERYSKNNREVYMYRTGKHEPFPLHAIYSGKCINDSGKKDEFDRALKYIGQIDVELYKAPKNMGLGAADHFAQVNANDNSGPSYFASLEPDDLKKLREKLAVYVLSEYHRSKPVREGYLRSCGKDSGKVVALIDALKDQYTSAPWRGEKTELSTQAVAICKKDADGHTFFKIKSL